MKKKTIISNIVLIGLVSLFIDMSTEMVYPLIPLFLTSVLGATPAIVGIIEGISESIASLLKVFSGYVGDVYQNKKRLIFIGYSASVVYKILLVLSASWIGILAARIIDRTGKGIRTAPRDALVAQSSEKNKLGGSFGLHKMLDMAGSALGALLAFVFLATGFGFSKAFIYSIIPAVIGIIIIPAIREAGSQKQTGKKLEIEGIEPSGKKLEIEGIEPTGKKLKIEGIEPAGKKPEIEGIEPSGKKLKIKGIKLDVKLKLYLSVIFIFCLGNSSNTFLLLKAHERGFSTSQVILLYLIFNISTSILAIPSGKLSDRFGRSTILVPGYVIYGLVYLGFALLVSKAAIIFLFIAYGAYTAFISGAERAFIAEAAPDGFKGTVLGIYGMLQGIGLLLSSIIAGIMWDRINSNAPFWFGGILGIFSALIIAVILGKKHCK